MPHDRVRAWRSSLGISKAALSRLVGCSPAMIFFIESGARRPGLDIALAIERESSSWEGGPIKASEWTVAKVAPATDPAPAPTGTV